MKKFLRIVVITCIAIGFMFSSCSSTGGKTANSGDSSSGVKIAGQKTYLRDWTGRTLGKTANPDWLGDAAIGNFNKYMAEYGVSSTDNVCRISTGMGKDLTAARMRANMDIARAVARDLDLKVSTKTAELARSGGMSEETAQAIETRTTTQSTVKVTGLNLKTEYYQLLETEDSRTGKASQQYVVYQIYVLPNDTWEQLRGKYLRDIIGKIPQELKPEQKEVAAMLDKMDYDEHHPVVMSQKQKEQSIEADKRILDA